MRSPPLPAAALAALLLLAPAAHPLEDPAPPEGEYARRLADYHRALAKPALRLAAWCHVHDLKLTTRRMDESIVRLDPEPPDPHVRLGHRKEGTAWKAPAKPLPPVLDLWTQERAKLYRKARDESLAESGAVIRDFARWCEGAGRAKEAREAWYVLLGFLPSDEEGRKALGYGTLDVSWVSTPLRDRAAREKWLEKEVRGNALQAGAKAVLLSQEQLDQLKVTDGWSPTLAASSLYGVATTFGLQEAVSFTRILHSSREAVRLLGLVPEKTTSDDDIWMYLVVKDREDYEILARAFTEDDPKKQKYYLSVSGFYAESRIYVCRQAKPEWVRSTLVHKAAEHLADEASKGRQPAWYTEGTACMAIEALGESGTSRCVASEPGTAESDPLDDPSAWSSILMAGLASGKDRELGKLVRLELNDLDGTALLQSWSLLWWMREVDPGRLQKFVARLAEGEDAEAACLAAFGCPAGAVDRAWRDWVRAQWSPTSVKK